MEDLQKYGLITRSVLSTFSISTEYSLTEKGEAVAKHLEAVREILKGD